MMDGPKSGDNCGWAPPRSGQVALFCSRRKIYVGGGQPLANCPCRHWVRRLRVDRLKRKAHHAV